MPTDTKRDPFKPTTPTIPGVPTGDRERKKTPPSAPKPPSYPATSQAPVAPQHSEGGEPTNWRMVIGICVAGCVLLAGMAIVWKMLHPVRPDPDAADVVPAPAPELASPPKTDVKLPVGPGVVATTGELAKAWSSKAFTYRDPITGAESPALVVHLPNGSYWGFSMIEPFGNCELEYVTNLGRLQDVYGFRADHPMVGDPCQHAVFDLMQYEGSPNGQVRGALVHGMGLRPPLAIEIEQHGREIRAVKIE